MSVRDWIKIISLFTDGAVILLHIFWNVLYSHVPNKLWIGLLVNSGGLFLDNALLDLDLCHLLDHLLLLLLDSDVLEVSPLGQDLHCLDVLDGRQLVSVVFVSAERIKVYFLAKTFVLTFYDLQNVKDLLTVVHLLVINTHDRVEDCPHHLWVVNSS